MPESKLVEIPYKPLIVYLIATNVVLLFFLAVGGYLVVTAAAPGDPRGPRVAVYWSLAVGFAVTGIVLWLMLVFALYFRIRHDLDWLLWRIGAVPSIEVNSAFESSHLRELDEIARHIDHVSDSKLVAYTLISGKVMAHELGDHLQAIRVTYEQAAQIAEGAGGAISEALVDLGEGIDQMQQYYLDLRAWLNPALRLEGWSTVRLDELVEQILANRYQNEGEGRVEYRLDAREVPLVHGLRGLFLGVVNNLIRNAFLHNPEHRRVDVTIQSPDQEGSVTLWVFDRGFWLDEAEIRAAFRWENDDPDHGVGLSLSRAIILSFGGDLFYWDRRSKGPGPFAEGALPADLPQRHGKAFAIRLPAAHPGSET